MAVLLNYLLLACLGLAVFFLGLVPFISPFPTTSAVFSLLFISLLAGLRALMASGRLRLTSWLLVAGLWVLLTVYTFFAGGPGAPGFIAFVIVILAGGLLLGEAVSLVMAVLSAAVGLAAYLGRSAGWLPPAGQEWPLGLWLLQTVAFLGVAGLLILAIRTYTGALRSLRGVVEDRRRAEAAWRESEGRYRLLFEGNPQLLWVYDRERLTFLAVNDAAVRHYGYSRAEFLGMPLQALWPAEEAPALLAWLNRPAGSVAGSARHRRQDGSLCEMELTASPLTFADRPAELVLAIDVTARRAAEAALRASETRYRRVVENSPMGMHAYQLEPDGRLVFIGANPAADRLLGIAHAPLAGRTLETIFPPLAQTEIPAHYRQVAAAGGVWETEQIEYRDQQLAGAYEVHAFQPAPGQVTAWFLDITGRQQQAAALRESEARYRALADSAQRQAQELALLDRARSALARAHDLPEVLRSIVEAIPAIFGYTQVSLYLRDGDALRLQHQVGYDHVFELIPLNRGITGQVARTGQPVLVSDVRAAPEFLGAIAGVTSEVCVPLYDQQRVAGVLNVETMGGVRMTEADLRLMTALGEHVSVAIERARLYTEASANERRFRALLENGADAIAIVDDQGLLQYASPSTARVVGFTVEEFVGANVFARVHPEELPEVRRVFSRLLEQPGVGLTAAFRFQHRDGSWRWLEATGTNLLAEPSVAGVVLNYRDVTDRKRAEEQLLRDAFRDALTGLSNRALLMDRLDQALRRAWRRDGYAFAVLLLDVDHFKVVNDSLGHTRGDELLVAIARRVEKVLRAADTFARLSGDEFVILLDDVSGPAEAATIAERVQEQLALPFPLGGLELVTSASIGIVLSEAGHESAEAVLRDADTAMYRAKAQGRARHEVFAVEMRAAALARLGLEADLRRALERDELCVYYQPIVAGRAGRPLGLEALVRWRHPERGLLAPAAFVPLAEESGLIVPIDRWVLRAAARQMRVWLARFPSVPPLTLNVNLSGRNFTQPDLPQQIEASLRAAGLGPASLHLEITESVIMENLELAVVILRQLHTLGVQIAIDDFGMGYSSLGYLAQLPVDTLKIDRRFVNQLAEGQAEIIQTIVNLARNLGRRTIAEGVETAEQHARLVSLGCDASQGYLHAPPLDAEAATLWLERWAGRPAAPPPSESEPL